MSGLSNCNENIGREDIMTAHVVCPSHHIAVLIDHFWSRWLLSKAMQLEITISSQPI